MYKHHFYPFLLLSTIFVLTILATALPPDVGPIGGRTKIPNVEANREVQSLGRFSVVRYNKNATTTTPHAVPLTFSRVVEAESQVVAGIKYYLKVVTRVGKYNTTEKLYDAVVVVKPWLKSNKKSRKLISFTPSPK